MAIESVFQAGFIKDLQFLFPEAFILKLDRNYIQGFPDRLMLYEDTWASFEFKRHIYSPRQPNQQYYVDLLNELSYASFVYPENKGQVLDEILRTFRPTRRARISRR